MYQAVLQMVCPAGGQADTAAAFALQLKADTLQQPDGRLVVRQHQSLHPM